MRRMVRVGIVCEVIRSAAKRSNTKRLREAVSRLKKEHGDVNLIILPAYPLTGPIFAIGEDKVQRFVWREAERIQVGHSRSKQSASLAGIVKIGEELATSLIIGPLFEKAGPRVYISAVVVDINGRVIGKYRKIGLGSMEKRIGISPGREPTVVRLEGLGLTLGLFIEEDILYPEIFRSLSLRGANMLVGFSLGRLELGGFTYHQNAVRSLATARSLEAGAPILVVGGIIELNGKTLHSFPTIVVDPEQPSPMEISLSGGDYRVVEIDVGSDALRRHDGLDVEILKLPLRSLELLGGKH